MILVGCFEDTINIQASIRVHLKLEFSLVAVCDLPKSVHLISDEFVLSFNRKNRISGGKIEYQSPLQVCAVPDDKFSI